MDDWNIQKRSDLCCECDAVFVAKAPYHTVLSFGARGYQRKDLCSTCWNASGGSVIREKAGVFSYWQGIYEPPAAPPPDRLPCADAETIFRAIMNRRNPEEDEARYILAVMLERKRILKHRETKSAGEVSSDQMENRKKVLVYENQQTGEVFMVPDPELRLDRLDEVQKRVAEMLSPASAPVPAETPSPSPAMG